MNSAWSGTVLELLVPLPDHREGVDVPPMTRAEQMRFAKQALSGIPGAARAFNDVFGAPRPVSDFVSPKLCGGEAVPAFLWAAK